ncbi:hypothetical protein SDC9_19900 [bioreactor metagenome]|uniref:Uncharacterized protein n=1 Tax=bioreactor metagenome TaxID=1076179 RepID=A0A644U577_9ZZZZ
MRDRPAAQPQRRGRQQRRQRRDQNGQRGDHEKGIAQPPAGTEGDKLAHRARGAGERGEDHDQPGAEDQRRPRADPARDEARYQHHPRGDEEIGGEEQRHLRWSRIQPGGDRGQDRIDQADRHEADDAGESGGPDRGRLVEKARWLGSAGGRMGHGKLASGEGQACRGRAGRVN